MRNLCQGPARVRGLGVSAIASALAASPAVRAAAEAVGAEAAWIAGGAVRDAALNREVVDVDLAVQPGTEEQIARAIAARPGRSAFSLSEQFGTWRCVASDEGWHVDVTSLRADDLEGDLMLRDFTVNAMAVPISELSAKPVDPSGGLADLERRVLCAVSANCFADDPLRLLRCARQGAGLGFDVGEQTIALGRASAGRAGEPAGERQLAELRALVAGPDPMRGLDLLDRIGATEGVLPELAALRGVAQNPNHHLDVHGHTLEVLRQVLVVERDVEEYAGQSAGAVRALFAQPLGDGFTRGDALRMGALVHDMGKPATRGESGGYVTFIGHDSVGAGIVGAACERLKMSRALRRHLEGLTRNHLHLGFMVHERPLSRRRLYEYLSNCGDVAPDVTMLTAADRMSARGSGAIAAPEMIAAHLELVREVLPEALRWQREGAPGLPLRGDELASELGIAEGPGLGEVLRELEAAVFAGEVCDRDGAVAHARAHLQ